MGSYVAMNRIVRVGCFCGERMLFFFFDVLKEHLEKGEKEWLRILLSALGS